MSRVIGWVVHEPLKNLVAAWVIFNLESWVVKLCLSYSNSRYCCLKPESWWAAVTAAWLLPGWNFMSRWAEQKEKKQKKKVATLRVAPWNNFVASQQSSFFKFLGPCVDGPVNKSERHSTFPSSVSLSANLFVKCLMSSRYSVLLTVEPHISCVLYDPVFLILFLFLLIRVGRPYIITPVSLHSTGLPPYSRKGSATKGCLPVSWSWLCVWMIEYSNHVRSVYAWGIGFDSVCF